MHTRTFFNLDTLMGPNPSSPRFHSFQGCSMLTPSPYCICIIPMMGLVLQLRYNLEANVFTYWDGRTYGNEGPLMEK